VAPRDLREGVERDIERLYRESAPQLWRSIYGFAGGWRHLAEDAVAEAFARAIERAHEIRDPLAWIYQTAFRIASRELQREKRGPPVAPDPVPGIDPAEVQDVMAALWTLSPNACAGTPCGAPFRIVSVEATTWKDDLAATAKPLVAGAGAGFLTGAVVGGIGGRLAMFVLRLTSDPALRGLKTDDDFTIGIFSGATLFLVIVTAGLGLIGGLVYLVVRAWLPQLARPWIFGGLTGIVGGAQVIRPGGIDFTLLEPLSLAIAMFIVLPAAYGVAVSLLAERLLAGDSAFRGSRVWMAGLVLLLPLGLFGAVGLTVIAALLAAVLVGRAAPQIASLWTSAPVTWIGRAGLVALATLAGIALVQDAAKIL
jgi:DNA-directed RNA polymerase specialized sigma24 family protein